MRFVRPRRKPLPKGGVMPSYEKPTLTPQGDFRTETGIGNKGPKDLLGGKQLL
ncbi:hypothetical protein JCM9534A_14630 [Catenuloplanes indicus JCM 9534]